MPLFEICEPSITPQGSWCSSLATNYSRAYESCADLFARLRVIDSGPHDATAVPAIHPFVARSAHKSHALPPQTPSARGHVGNSHSDMAEPWKAFESNFGSWSASESSWAHVALVCNECDSIVIPIVCTMTNPDERMYLFLRCEGR